MIKGIKVNDSVTIIVAQPGYRFISGGLITAGEKGYEASDLVVAAPTMIAAGHVLAGDGSPAAGAIVSAPGANPLLRATTDDTGYFVMEGLPDGDVNLLAASGNQYGKASIKAGDTKASITLNQSNVERFSDIAKGKAILTDLINKSTDDTYPMRESLPMEIARFDLTAAIKLANASTKPSDDVLLGLVAEAAIEQPDKTYDQASDLIEKISDPIKKSMAAAIYGINIATKDVAKAKRLLDRAKEWDKQSTFDSANGNDRILIAALAGKVGDLSASQIIKETMSHMIAAAKEQATAQTTYNKEQKKRYHIKESEFDTVTDANIISVNVEGYARAIAPAGSKYIEQLLGQVPSDVYDEKSPDVKLTPYLIAASILAHYDSIDAVGLLQRSVHADCKLTVYGQAIDNVVESLPGTSSSDAMSLAETVSDPDHQAVALALAASKGTLDATVWTRILDTALTSKSKSAIAGWISAKGAALDSQLGVQLFDLAYKDLTKDPATTPDLSPFMYFYSRIKPDLARTVIEKEYALALRASDARGSSDFLIPPVLAMTSIDVTRATEMASAAQGSTRFLLLRKIAQFIMLSKDQQRILRFDRWALQDTWQPGTPMD
jgi:hypothetical protein